MMTYSVQLFVQHHVPYLQNLPLYVNSRFKAIMFQSTELKDAVHYLSELVGSYDADTLCCACQHLAETIKKGIQIT